MGLERTMTATKSLDWLALVDRLKAFGESPVLRMIDGLPAFPDETPEPGWNELRIGFAGGMVTLRRTSDGYAFVTWGTADPALQRSTESLVCAVGELTTG